MNTEIVILIIVIVLVAALFVVSYMRKKKFNGELGTMREELKVGDKVMTDTGVVGEVVDSFTEEEYKYFVLKTGRGNNIGYFTIHANAVYYSFEKEKEKQLQAKTVIKPVEKQGDNKMSEVEKAVSAKKSNTTSQNTKTKTSNTGTKNSK